MTKATRLITIETRGPIPQKSGISGPINQPYREDVRVIARMVMGKIAVREHLGNDESRILTVKDLPDLTAEAPAVLARNEAIKKEINRSQEIIREQKASDLEKAKAKLSGEEKAPVVPTPAAPAPEAPKTVEQPAPDLAAMTKAERKAHLQKQAENNVRKEEVVETK